MRLKGQMYFTRFADDFIIGFEYKEDAEKVFAVMPKRFKKFGLTIHPEKTQLSISIVFHAMKKQRNTYFGTFSILITQASEKLTEEFADNFVKYVNCPN